MSKPITYQIDVRGNLNEIDMTEGRTKLTPHTLEVRFDNRSFTWMRITGEVIGMDQVTGSVSYERADDVPLWARPLTHWQNWVERED